MFSEALLQEGLASNHVRKVAALLLLALLLRMLNACESFSKRLEMPSPFSKATWSICVSS